MTETERRLRSQIGAHASWANTPDRSARTAPARRALEDRFLEEAGGDPAKAAHIKKAYYARLALKSAVARRRAREATQVAQSAEAELAAMGDADGAA